MTNTFNTYNISIVKEVRIFLDVRGDNDISGVVDGPGLHIVNDETIEGLEQQLRHWYKVMENEENITFDYVFDKPKDKFFFHD